MNLRPLPVLMALWLATSALGSETMPKAGYFAQFEAIEGRVSYDGKQVRPGERIAQEGYLVTGPKAYAVLRFFSQGELKVAENARMKVQRLDTRSSKDSEDSGSDAIHAPFQLEKGVVRWRTQEKRRRFLIRTHSVALGERGTDFTVSFDPMLDETETVVFEGAVEIVPLRDQGPSVTVEAGKWAGQGGRFGERISAPLSLSPAALRHYRKMAEFPKLTIHQNSPSTPDTSTSAPAN